MAASLPRLIENDVENYIPDPYFQRGRNYYHSGAIFDTVRRGSCIEGYCEGSASEPYHVVVTLGEDGIAGDTCTCPMDGGCKHVVALLLAWVHKPKEFSERQPVNSALEGKTKDELIALVQAMLQRVPELERLLDLSMPGKSGKGDQRRTRVDAETYRRQIRYAMRDADDWEAVFGIAREIGLVVDIGDGFADQEDWENAQIVYQTVLDEGLAHYMETQDEGDIGSEIGRAVDGMGECLAARAGDTEARQAILASLFEVLKWDIGEGGLGMSDGVPELLQQHATIEDRAEIRKWIVAEIKNITGSEWSRDYRREAWGRLLLSFADDENVDEFLEQAGKQGLHKPVFDKLIQLGRLDEALDVAQRHLTTTGWERLQAAQSLYEAGRQDDALVFAKAGLPDKDLRLAEWVAEEYARRGDTAGALELQLTRWQARPEMKLYETLEQLAKKLQQWEPLRPRLLAELEKSSHATLLADIYLRDQEWDAAWAVAEKARTSKLAWGWGNLLLHVAQVSDKHRPQKAIPVYLDAAERLIEKQGRKNYAAAAGYLHRARDLFSAMKRSDEWQKTIADLRQRHRNLPALQDELRKAGV
ncbi:MAG: SWIM zinc finger family protein [Anaerolineales bacterium]|nr:SWIM zinc finger family protein [Anaerolineales bacterium]